MTELDAANSRLLIERLQSLRRIVRRRLLAYGVFAVLSGGVAALLTILMLDWLLWLPSVLRTVGGLLFVIGFLLATRYWIIVPYRYRISLASLAGRLEKHFPHLQDRLSSTVGFLDRGDAGSAAMMQQVVENTNELVRGLPFESVLVIKPIVIRAGFLAVGIGVLASVVVFAPNWLDIGVARYLQPFSQTEWPRHVSITPLTGDMTAAMGESVTVRMSITRGWKRTLRAVVHVSEADGSKTTRALHRNPQGEFIATLDAVTKPLIYWFEAGDDSTARTPFQISVVKRPAVVESLAEIEPPRYAPESAARSHDLRDGPAVAPLGGFVTVHVFASKPIESSAEPPQTGLVFEDGSFVALEAREGSSRRLAARMAVDRDMHFRVRLIDKQGLENRNPTIYSILGTLDTPPTVTIVKPRSIVETTPSGRIAMVVRVEDDYGITELLLESKRQGDEQIVITSLEDELTITSGLYRVEGLATHDWQLSRLELEPGDVLTYTVAARDNYTDDDAAGQQSRSPLQRVKIISEVEFDTRVRNELASLEGRLRRVVLDEADILDRTPSLMRSSPDDDEVNSDTDDVGRARASILAGEQERLVRRVQDIADRLMQLQQRVARNNEPRANSFEHIGVAGRATRQVGRGAMTVALQALSDVAESIDRATRQSSLRMAADSERAAVRKLEEILNELSRHGDFESMVATGRDLLDRQTDVRRLTVELGKALLGKTVDALVDEERSRLNRVAARQDQVVRDTERWIARMKRVGKEIEAGDPAGSETIEDALRASRAHAVSKRMRAAAAAIAQNRTAGAAIDQRQAIEGLRKVLEAMDGREQRELLVLQKQLEQFEEQVARLRGQQAELRAATHEADVVGADRAVLDDLHRRQRLLRTNAGALALDLAATKRSASAAAPMNRAVSSMREAEGHLLQVGAGAATAPQDTAIAALDDCLSILEEEADKAAENLFRRTLAKIQQHLEELRAEQKEINAGIVAVVKRVLDAGRLNRKSARQAAGLAVKQAELKGRLLAIAGTLKQVPVYDWALGRVKGWMSTCQQRLSQRELDGGLVATAQRIVRELDKLIGALDETQGLPMDSEFAEADGGGGNQGGSVKNKAVPTVAELIVLKYMQREITERTAAFDATTDLEAATEAQLGELAVLGEDQAEVRRLTELVIDGGSQR